MTQLALMPLALGTELIHIYSYDFYKESYLYRTRLDWDGHPERASDVRDRLQRMAAQKAPWRHTPAATDHDAAHEPDAGSSRARCLAGG